MSNEKDQYGIVRDEFPEEVNAFLQAYKEFPEQYLEFTEMIFHPHELFDPKTDAPYPTLEGTLKRKSQIYLGHRHDVFLDVAIITQDIKTGCNTRGCWCKKRRVEGQCWAWFSHPRLDEVFRDVEECAQVAALAATIALIWSDTVAAYPTFKATFIGCMKAKAIEWADEIGIGLYKVEHRGQWIPCEN